MVSMRLLLLIRGMSGISSQEDENRIIYSAQQLIQEAVEILDFKEAGDFNQCDLKKLAHAYSSAMDEGPTSFLNELMQEFEKTLRESPVKAQKQVFYSRVITYAQQQNPAIKRQNLPSANQFAEEFHRVDPENIWSICTINSKYAGFSPKEVMIRLANLDTTFLLALGFKVKQCLNNLKQIEVLRAPLRHFQFYYECLKTHQSLSKFKSQIKPSFAPISALKQKITSIAVKLTAIGFTSEESKHQTKSQDSLTIIEDDECIAVVHRKLD